MKRQAQTKATSKTRAKIAIDENTAAKAIKGKRNFKIGIRTSRKLRNPRTPRGPNPFIYLTCIGTLTGLPFPICSHCFLTLSIPNLHLA